MKRKRRIITSFRSTEVIDILLLVYWIETLIMKKRKRDVNGVECADTETL